MLTAWKCVEKGLAPIEGFSLDAMTDDCIWLDLHEPTNEEKLAVNAANGVDLPTFNEMSELETSNRLYRASDVTYITATHLSDTQTDCARITAIAYVLTTKRLITVRHEDSMVFKTFIERAPKSGITCADNAFVTFMEITTGLLADLLEHVNRELEKVSNSVFRHNQQDGIETRLQTVILKIGTAANLSGKVRESLSDKVRVLLFAENLAKEWSNKDAATRLQVALRDVQALSDFASFMEDKISFLLDATVGMISIDQNRVIKIFSIVAVIFMPPTLIASIYGMNFKNGMYELDWRFGYPYALAMMVLSAVLTLWFFRSRRWV